MFSPELDFSIAFFCFAGDYEAFVDWSIPIT